MVETDAAWPVMVLAHNEEVKIAACLDSIFAAEPDRALEVYVMANGCTDRTEEVVREYAEKRPEVRLVSIALGDKCNAWNVFVHDTIPTECPGRDVYIFMDGDATVGKSALSTLVQALHSDSHAHAASAVPGSGRSKAGDRRAILEQHGLVANLYALRGSFVDRARALGVRLPLRLEGDDGLVAALVKWNLEPGRGWDNSRVHPCAEAVFEFDSVSVSDLKEWRNYWRRLVRYGRSYYEFRLLGRRLSEMGLAGLPQDIQDLYPDAEGLKQPWRGVRTFTDAIALREMRRIGRARRRVNGTVGDGQGRMR
ncbi:MAG: glycosyltransferase family A protein [Gammaproteobacteria bacterium]